MGKATIIDRICYKFFSIVRKTYSIFGDTYEPHIPISEKDPQKANQMIYDLLLSDSPCMIGRFGSNEIECTVFYRNRKYFKYDILNFARGISDCWWYTDSIIYKMYNNAGFFSPTTEYLDRFGEEMMSAIEQVDILGSWVKEEDYFKKELQNAKLVDLELLNPFWGISSTPWSMALKGKKVLVVHPFAETIQTQYAQKEHLHKDPRILPDFHLITLKAIQSITGLKPEGFDNWFDALYYMEQEIDKIDYDICIIGCGAYGFLLAAHCKRQGKKAIHLGGATQLLFGIRGKRWEDPNYGYRGTSYLSFMTPHWTRPATHETPQKSGDIENGCYW